MFWAEIWKISIFFIWKFSVVGDEIFLYVWTGVFSQCVFALEDNAENVDFVEQFIDLENTDFKNRWSFLHVIRHPLIISKQNFNILKYFIFPNKLGLETSFYLARFSPIF